MKKVNIHIQVVLLLVSLLVALPSFSQTTYNRIFSGPSYDEGIAVFRLPNKEIRLVGNTGSYGQGSTDVWLIALDSMGEFMWHKFYGGTEVEKVNDAVMTPQGDIFMVGSTTQNTAQSYQVYFLGLDQYGQIITYRNIGGVDWDFGYGICQIDDTSFAISGETYSQGNGKSDAYIVKVNRQGDTIWTRTFGGVEEDKGNSITLMPDSSLLMVGATKSYGNGSFDFFLIKLDVNGDTIWTSVKKHITDAELFDAVINPNTTIVACGYKKDSLDSYRNNELVKFSGDGEFKWSAVSSIGENEDSYIKSIIRESNSDLVMAGITTEYGAEGSSNARVIKTMNSGWWKASNSPGDKQDDNAHSIIEDNFHGKHYLMVGTTKSFNVSKSGIFFVRLDSSLHYDTTRILNTPTSIYSLIQKNNASMHIFPNPVTDILTIAFQGTEPDFELFIYQIGGALVYSNKYSGAPSSISIPVDDFASGFYYVIYRSKNQSIHTRFIKIGN